MAVYDLTLLNHPAVVRVIRGRVEQAVTRPVAAAASTMFAVTAISLLQSAVPIPPCSCVRVRRRGTEVHIRVRLHRRVAGRRGVPNVGIGPIHGIGSWPTATWALSTTPSRVHARDGYVSVSSVRVAVIGRQFQPWDLPSTPALHHPVLVHVSAVLHVTFRRPASRSRHGGCPCKCRRRPSP